MAELKGYGIVHFHVYDKISLRPIEGVTCHVAQFTGVSDSQGIITFGGYPLGPQLAAIFTSPNYADFGMGAIFNISGATIEVPLVPKTGVTPPPVMYSLTISKVSGGTSTPPPGTYSFSAGTVVTNTAIPDQGYEVVRGDLNGVPKTATASLAVIMDQDYRLDWTFEKGAAPPGPPVPGMASLKETVLERDTGKPLKSATVALDGLTGYTDDSGIASLPLVEAGDRTLAVSLAGYDSQSMKLHFEPGQARVESVSLAKAAIFDPWGALTNALGGIWNLFLGAMTTFGKGLLGPLQSQAKDLLSQAQGALSAGSPDKETEEKAKKLTEATRRRQDEIIREMYKGSPDLELAPDVASTLMTLFLGTEVTLELIGIGLDITHPMKAVGARRLAERITDSLGTGRLTSDIATMPARVGLLPQLVYWYNKQYTPLIPNLQDLITMLVREVITPEQYVDLAAMQGESKTWADRRWETHWRLPSPEYVIEAYHRGILDKAELDKFIVWHDYRPGARPGISKSDLEILGGLLKTLIPRVDLRRGWELGLIDDDSLIERYRWLGYEDDAELMAEIQKAAALEGERAAVARAAGRRFRELHMKEADFRELLTRMYIIGERQDLWVLRYILERTVKPTAAEEAAEEIISAPSETELG